MTGIFEKPSCLHQYTAQSKKGDDTGFMDL